MILQQKKGSFLVCCFFFRKYKFPNLLLPVNCTNTHHSSRRLVWNVLNWIYVYIIDEIDCERWAIGTILTKNDDEDFRLWTFFWFFFLLYRTHTHTHNTPHIKLHTSHTQYGLIQYVDDVCLHIHTIYLMYNVHILFHMMYIVHLHMIVYRNTYTPNFMGLF